jgi:hypothetical protein
VQKQRFLAAVFVAFAFLVPGLFANGPVNGSPAAANKPKKIKRYKPPKIKRYKAPKVNRKSNKIH